MVTCSICKKDFKTTQGLRGHNYFVHNNNGDLSMERVAQQAQQAEQYSGHRPAAPVTTEHRLSELEHKLALLEQPTEMEADKLDDVWNVRAQPLAEQLAQLGQQLNTLASSSLSQAELSPVFERLDELSQQLTSLKFSYQSLFDETSTLEKELGEKADQGTAMSIEARIAELEKAQTEYGKFAKALVNSQAQSMQNIVYTISKLAEMVSCISNQVGEQKQVTDWVKKKFELVLAKA